jgi:hypothetical protein
VEDGGVCGTFIFLSVHKSFIDKSGVCGTYPFREYVGLIHLGGHFFFPETKIIYD